MKDAFGGSYMIMILLVFIVIYVGFIGIAINYGKAFRIKNEVIDYLEKNEINDIDNASAQSGIKTVLDGKGYTNNEICTNSFTAEEGKKCINNVIVNEHSEEKNGVNYVYYTVDSYIGYNLGFLNSLLSLARSNSSDTISGYWRISGQTRIIISN